MVTIVCNILALPSNKGYLATDNIPVHLREPLTLSDSHLQGSGVLLPFRAVVLKPLIVHVFLYESLAIQIQAKLLRLKILRNKSKLTI